MSKDKDRRLAGGKGNYIKFHGINVTTTTGVTCCLGFNRCSKDVASYS